MLYILFLTALIALVHVNALDSTSGAACLQATTPEDCQLDLSCRWSEKNQFCYSVDLAEFVHAIETYDGSAETAALQQSALKLNGATAMELLLLPEEEADGELEQEQGDRLDTQLDTCRLIAFQTACWVSSSCVWVNNACRTPNPKCDSGKWDDDEDECLKHNCFYFLPEDECESVSSEGPFGLGAGILDVPAELSSVESESVVAPALSEETEEVLVDAIAQAFELAFADEDGEEGEVEGMVSTSTGTLDTCRLIAFQLPCWVSSGCVWVNNACRTPNPKCDSGKWDDDEDECLKHNCFYFTPEDECESTKSDPFESIGGPLGLEAGSDADIDTDVDGVVMRFEIIEVTEEGEDDQLLDDGFFSGLFGANSEAEAEKDDDSSLLGLDTCRLIAFQLPCWVSSGCVWVNNACRTPNPKCDSGKWDDDEYECLKHNCFYFLPEDECESTKSDPFDSISIDDVHTLSLARNAVAAANVDADVDGVEGKAGADAPVKEIKLTSDHYLF